MKLSHKNSDKQQSLILFMNTWNLNFLAEIQ